MKLVTHLRTHQLLYAVLIVAMLVRLVFLFEYHEVWWDSGVYVGMAKYVWSAGTAGLWEHIRPVLWPMILGMGWWLNLSVLAFARMLEFVLSLASIVLVYALGKNWFSHRAAVLASMLWAFSSIVLHLGFHEYTELPAVTLVLAALLAFTYKHSFFAGLLAGLAFLTKFPEGIFIVVLGVAVVVYKRWKQLVPLSVGFVLPVTAFFVLNQALYGAALSPLLAAQHAISNVLGCNVLRYRPWYYYLGWMVFDNVLNVFAVLGIGAVIKSRDKRFVLPALALVIPAAYFMQMHCREYRYLTLFLPFVVLFTGHGLALLTAWFERVRVFRKHVWTLVLLVTLGVSAATGILFYHENELRTPDTAAEQYFHWLEDKQIEGEIWSANPVVSVYSNQFINKIYYPVYGQGTATDFNEYLRKHQQRIGAILLDNCGGGIICPADDEQCAREFAHTRAFLNENFRQVFFEQSGNCWYAVYTH